MEKENVSKVIQWFENQIKDKPPEGKWIHRTKLIKICKELDIPISFLESHQIISECKGACYLKSERRWD